MKMMLYEKSMNKNIKNTFSFSSPLEFGTTIKDNNDSASDNTAHKKSDSRRKWCKWLLVEISSWDPIPSDIHNQCSPIVLCEDFSSYAQQFNSRFLIERAMTERSSQLTPLVIENLSLIVHAVASTEMNV